MALYIVQFEDKPNMGELRDKLLKSHFEFLDRVKDRVLVLSPRPATIQTTIHVNLPHPRKLSSPEAQDLREAILKEIGL